MDGVFCNKRWNAILHILGLISGAVLPVLFGVLLWREPDTPMGDALLAWFFMGFGILAAVFCGVSLYVNQRVFIHAEEEHLSGYFHFGLALECRIDEIDAVSYGGTGLILRLKNGRKYNMHHLENACALGMYIKRHMPLPPPTTQTEETLLQAFQAARKKRKSCALGLLGGFVLVFAGIFLTLWLTGGREMRDFLPRDWQVFRTMLLADAVLGAILVVLVRRFIRHSEACQRNLEDLHLLVLRTAPLLPGNVRKVYIAMEDHPPIRVTVCGFPQSEEVYYMIEQINLEHQSQKVYESKIYPNMEALLPELEGLTELEIFEK